MAVMTNEQLFKRYFDEVANGGNLDLADEIFAEDYRHHDPANPDPRPMIGSQAVKDHLTSLKGAFPDLVFDVEDTISDGDQIIVRWTARGTNTGDYFGMPATGKSIEITGMNTWRTRDGKAIEGWVNRDDMGLLQQLGVVPAPG
jgi:steroid delta-isomerase-like uncharacterized protein